MLKIIRLIYFPISVLTTSFIIFPACLIRPFSYKNTELFLRVFKFLTIKPFGFNIKIENEFNLEGDLPAIIIANHQSNYDLICANTIFPNKVVSLGKKEIAFIPLFGIIYVLAGNIVINRSNRERSLKSMEKVKKLLNKSKIAICIFPEGTRSKGLSLLQPFKKGAFHTAKDAGLPIIPVTVSPYINKINLNKMISVNINVKYHRPIQTNDKTVQEIINESRSIMLSELNKYSLN